MSDDWLSLDTPPAPTMAGGQPIKMPNQKAEALRREHLRLKRKLNLQHRLYLDALVKNNFHIGNANRLMKVLGYPYDRSSFTRWRQRKDLSHAIEVTKEYIETSLGLSGAGVLAVTKQIADHGLDLVPVIDRFGKVVIDPKTDEPLMRMRDADLALKANELLGKNQKLWGNDQQSTRVTVNIVDLSGKSNFDEAGQTYEGVVDG